MQKKHPNFSNRTLKVTHKESGPPPRGALFLGVVNGQRLYLTARDRSFHLLIIGAIGTGKTVTMEGLCRLDITSRHGICLIDPMGALVERLTEFCCYSKAIGRPIGEVIQFNASDGNWVLPFNTFVRRDGELAVQVDRRVASTLRAWNQHSGDETPRLEKWLRCLYTVLIECNLSLLEAGLLLDQHSHDVRAFLARGLSDELIRSKLEQLSRYKPSEFSEQTESVENRLMRFLTSGHLRRIFGSGTSALDFRRIMDEGKILLVNLQPSKYLSREQQRLIGTFVLNEFFETALTRPSGARPFYCYVDEAAQFVTPELAEALEQCRQKGLHLTLAFQHLAQFKEEGVRIYKAFKNVRNKIVFAIPDRQDALELADDLFVGLAEPELKFMHRRLNHLVEDIRQTSTTISNGHGQSAGRSRGQATGRSLTISRSYGQSLEQNTGEQQGMAESRELTHGRSQQNMQGQSHTESETEAHSWGYADSTSFQETTSSSTTTNNGQSSGTIDSVGTTVTVTQSPDGDVLVAVDGKTQSRGTTQTRTVGHADTHGRSVTTGDSHTHSTQEMLGTGTSDTTSTAITTGTNISRSRGQSRQHSTSRGNSVGKSQQRGRSQSHSRTLSTSDSQERSTSQGFARTDQPGVRHTPFWEEDPEHWSLEEQRWRASELLMSQQIGHWFIRTSSALGFGQSYLPEPFYMTPKQRQRLTRDLYQRHNLTPEQADQLIAQRRSELLAKVAQDQRDEADPDGVPNTNGQSKQVQIWNRTVDAAASDRSANGSMTTPRARKRGPRPDLDTHAKVAALVSIYGQAWRIEENLREICEKLDKVGVPIPKTWPSLRTHPARSWSRALEFHADLVKKAIEYHCSAPKTAQS